MTHIEGHEGFFSIPRLTVFLCNQRFRLKTLLARLAVAGRDCEKLLVLDRGRGLL
jgi:hypothetical protein